MQKHQTNLRQAGESAAPGQEFATPQDEIRHLRKTDGTLAGFARILEVVRISDFYNIDQGNGAVHKNWLVNHDAYCGSCVGALLAWYYRTPTDRRGDYRFNDGRAALAGRLGLSEAQLKSAVNRARRKVADPGRRGYCCADPFGGCAWSVDYAEVFHELARMFPGK